MKSINIILAEILIHLMSGFNCQLTSNQSRLTEIYCHDANMERIIKVDGVSQQFNDSDNQIVLFSGFIVCELPLNNWNSEKHLLNIFEQISKNAADVTNSISFDDTINFQKIFQSNNKTISTPNGTIIRTLITRTLSTSVIPSLILNIIMLLIYYMPFRDGFDFGKYRIILIFN